MPQNQPPVAATGEGSAPARQRPGRRAVKPERQWQQRPCIRLSGRHVRADRGCQRDDAQLSEMMGDAPVCDVCGHITVRNGACYKCLNCGNSLGCS